MRTKTAPFFFPLVSWRENCDFFSPTRSFFARSVIHLYFGINLFHRRNHNLLLEASYTRVILQENENNKKINKYGMDCNLDFSISPRDQ